MFQYFLSAEDLRVLFQMITLTFISQVEAEDRVWWSTISVSEISIQSTTKENIARLVSSCKDHAHYKVYSSLYYV